MVIAIDGTSGSGKSTIAKILADKLGFNLLNTGILYRKITKLCLDRRIPASDEEEIIKQISLVSVDSIDPSNLHTEEISRNVPHYAKIESVRNYVRSIQRKSAIGKNIIVEGRDIGSRVFPDAEVKLFIDADIKIRTERRLLQLELDYKDNYYKVLENIKNRDSHDENRTNSPLIKSDDALYVDTGNKSITQVIDEILESIKSKFA